MSDSIIVATCACIGVFVAALYLVMAWPLFMAVAAVWLIWKVCDSGVCFLKLHTGKQRRIPGSI